jgi:hypothetical protein
MEPSTTSGLRFSFYASLLLTLLTIATFGFAMIAIPPSGPYCPGDCMEYPFRDLLNYYPRDYYWMYLAVFQLFSFMIFIMAIHHLAAAQKKLYSSISVAFGVITTTTLLIAYFVQFAVVPISMMKGETEGIALLTQYNGHGIFIALEELGYITMSITMFFLAPVFPATTRLARLIRWLLGLPLFLNVLAFVFYAVQFGIDRSYRFEVASISIDWLFLIIAGVFISIYCRSLMKKM